MAEGKQGTCWLRGWLLSLSTQRQATGLVLLLWQVADNSRNWQEGKQFKTNRNYKTVIHINYRTHSTDEVIIAIFFILSGLQGQPNWFVHRTWRAGNCDFLFWRHWRNRGVWHHAEDLFYQSTLGHVSA